jgi:ankyrin repeat protein
MPFVVVDQLQNAENCQFKLYFSPVIVSFSSDIVESGPVALAFVRSLLIRLSTAELPFKEMEGLAAVNPCDSAAAFQLAQQLYIASCMQESILQAATDIHLSQFADSLTNFEEMIKSQSETVAKSLNIKLVLRGSIPCILADVNGDLNAAVNILNFFLSVDSRLRSDDYSDGIIVVPLTSHFSDSEKNLHVGMFKGSVRQGFDTLQLGGNKIVPRNKQTDIFVRFLLLNRPASMEIFLQTLSGIGHICNNSSIKEELEYMASLTAELLFKEAVDTANVALAKLLLVGLPSHNKLNVPGERRLSFIQYSCQELLKASFAEDLAKRDKLADIVAMLRDRGSNLDAVVELENSRQIFDIVHDHILRSAKEIFNKELDARDASIRTAFQHRFEGVETELRQVQDNLSNIPESRWAAFECENICSRRIKEFSRAYASKVFKETLPWDIDDSAYVGICVEIDELRCKSDRAGRGICNKHMFLHPPRSIPPWTCDAPEHQGNKDRSYNDSVYACTTMEEAGCNYQICKECYYRRMFAKKVENVLSTFCRFMQAQLQTLMKGWAAVASDQVVVKDNKPLLHALVKKIPYFGDVFSHAMLSWATTQKILDARKLVQKLISNSMQDRIIEDYCTRITVYAAMDILPDTVASSKDSPLSKVCSVVAQEISKRVGTALAKIVSDNPVEVMSGVVHLNFGDLFERITSVVKGITPKDILQASCEILFKLVSPYIKEWSLVYKHCDEMRSHWGPLATQYVMHFATFLSTEASSILEAERLGERAADDIIPRWYRIPAVRLVSEKASGSIELSNELANICALASHSDTVIQYQARQVWMLTKSDTFRSSNMSPGSKIIALGNDDTVVICFVRAYSVSDWLPSIKSTQLCITTSLGVDGKADVHSGFAGAVQKSLKSKAALCDDTLEEITMKWLLNDKIKVCFTGHGAGGSCALLMFLHFRESFVRRRRSHNATLTTEACLHQFANRVTVQSFGAPAWVTSDSQTLIAGILEGVGCQFTCRNDSICSASTKLTGYVFPAPMFEISEAEVRRFEKYPVTEDVSIAASAKMIIQQIPRILVLSGTAWMNEVIWNMVGDIHSTKVYTRIMEQNKRCVLPERVDDGQVSKVQPGEYKNVILALNSNVAGMLSNSILTSHEASILSLLEIPLGTSTTAELQGTADTVSSASVQEVMMTVDSNAGEDIFQFISLHDDSGFKHCLATAAIVGQRSSTGKSVLIDICCRNRINMLRILLDHMTTFSAEALEINARDAHGLSAVEYAVHQGHVEVVQMLLALPDIHLNDADLSLLSVAAIRHFEEIADLLICCKGVDVNHVGAVPTQFANVEEGYELLMWIEDVDAEESAKRQKPMMTLQSLIRLQGQSPAELAGTHKYLDDLLFQSIDEWRDNESKVGKRIGILSKSRIEPLFAVCCSGSHAQLGRLLGRADLMIGRPSSNELLSALNYLAGSNKLNFFETLLNDARMDINATDALGRTAFMTACRRRKYANAAKILECRSDARIDIVDKSNASALHWAAASGDASIVKLIVNCGRPIDMAATSSRGTALEIALTTMNKEVMYELLSTGAFQCFADVTTLFSADNFLFGTVVDFMLFNDLDLLARLVTGNSEIVNNTCEGGRGLLHVAASMNRAEATRALLRFHSTVECDINLRDSMDGWTALHLAASQGYKDIVEILLEHCADVNLVADIDAETIGLTPMMMAAANGHIDVTRKLLLHDGASLDDSRSIIFLAGLGDAELLNELLMRMINPDINCKGVGGVSAFVVAAGLGHIDCCNCLLGNQALDLNATIELPNMPGAKVTLLQHLIGWRHGNSAASEAALTYVQRREPNVTAKELRDRNFKILEALVCSPRLDPNLIVNGVTALMLAVNSDDYEACCLLLRVSPKVDVDVTGQHGMTALHVAAQKGSVKVMKLILDHSSFRTINPQLTAGETPLLFAIVGFHTDAVRLLLQTPGIVASHILNGDTYLHALARQQQPQAEMFRVLLGNDKILQLINAINSEEGTALSYCCTNESNLECVSVLLDHGAAVRANVSTSVSNSLLLAINCKNRAVVDLILTRNPPIVVDFKLEMALAIELDDIATVTGILAHPKCNIEPDAYDAADVFRAILDMAARNQTTQRLEGICRHAFPLYQAALQDRPQATELILNYLSGKGKTYVDVACACRVAAKLKRTNVVSKYVSSRLLTEKEEMEALSEFTSENNLRIKLIFARSLRQITENRLVMAERSLSQCLQVCPSDFKLNSLYAALVLFRNQGKEILKRPADASPNHYLLAMLHYHNQSPHDSYDALLEWERLQAGTGPRLGTLTLKTLILLDLKRFHDAAKTLSELDPASEAVIISDYSLLREYLVGLMYLQLGQSKSAFLRLFPLSYQDVHFAEPLLYCARIVLRAECRYLTESICEQLSKLRTILPLRAKNELVLMQDEIELDKYVRAKGIQNQKFEDRLTELDCSVGKLFSSQRREASLMSNSSPPLFWNINSAKKRFQQVLAGLDVGLKLEGIRNIQRDSALTVETMDAELQLIRERSSSLLPRIRRGIELVDPSELPKESFFALVAGLFVSTPSDAGPSITRHSKAFVPLLEEVVAPIIELQSFASFLLPRMLEEVRKIHASKLPSITDMSVRSDVRAALNHLRTLCRSLSALINSLRGLFLYYSQFHVTFCNFFGTESEYCRMFQYRKEYYRAILAAVMQRTYLWENKIGVIKGDELIQISAEGKLTEGEDIFLLSGFQEADPDRRELYRKLLLHSDTSQSNTRTNAHYVVEYDGVHFKLNPYAAGIEFTVNSLNRLLLDDIAVPTRLIKLTGLDCCTYGSMAFYQAARSVSGVSFAKVIASNYVNKIDPKSFSALFLSSLLVGTGDCKPDNLIAQFEMDPDNRSECKSIKLIDVDKDIAFCSGRLGFRRLSNTGGMLYSDFLNVLFFLPQMDSFMDSGVVAEIGKTGAPERIVSSWLLELYRQNERYGLLTDSGFTAQDLEELRLPIRLPKAVVTNLVRLPGTAEAVYRRLKRMHELFVDKSTITHSSLLREFYPSVSQYYDLKRAQFDDPSQALKEMYIETVEDPEIKQSLATKDRLKSVGEWSTASLSRELDKERFKERFNGSIEEIAAEFLAAVDFANLDRTTAEIVVNNLCFLEEFRLKNVSHISSNDQFDAMFGKWSRGVLDRSTIKLKRVFLLGMSEESRASLCCGNVFNRLTEQGVSFAFEDVPGEPVLPEPDPEPGHFSDDVGMLRVALVQLFSFASDIEHLKTTPAEAAVSISNVLAMAKCVSADDISKLADPEPGKQSISQQFCFLMLDYPTLLWRIGEELARKGLFRRRQDFLVRMIVSPDVLKFIDVIRAVVKHSPEMLTIRDPITHELPCQLLKRNRIIPGNIRRLLFCDMINAYTGSAVLAVAAAGAECNLVELIVPDNIEEELMIAALGYGFEVSVAEFERCEFDFCKSCCQACKLTLVQRLARRKQPFHCQNHAKVCEVVADIVPTEMCGELIYIDYPADQNTRLYFLVSSVLQRRGLVRSDPFIENLFWASAEYSVGPAVQWLSYCELARQNQFTEMLCDVYKTWATDSRVDDLVSKDGEHKYATNSCLKKVSKYFRIVQWPFTVQDALVLNDSSVSDTKNKVALAQFLNTRSGSLSRNLLLQEMLATPSDSFTIFNEQKYPSCRKVIEYGADPYISLRDDGWTPFQLLQQIASDEVNSEASQLLREISCG